jgi:NAD(P)-dependent dehydrogenase (short-subunit alcohol dehydrogenase family)
MEGVFNRPNKQSSHPHTNMAKASLNMITRTSAQQFINDNIYMNSVDTGWVTE